MPEFLVAIPVAIGEFLEWLESKSAQYYGLILAVIVTECYFAFRAQAMYQGLFSATIKSPIEMAVICVVVFAVILVGGFFVSTIEEEKREGWTKHLPRITDKTICLIVVIAHDVAGAFYISYPTGITLSMIETNIPKVIVTLGICSLSFLPIKLAGMAARIRKELEAERKETYANHGSRLERNSARIVERRWRKELKHMPNSVLFQFLPKELRDSAQAIINYVTNIELEKGKVSVAQLSAPALPKKTEQKAPEKPAKVIDLKARTAQRNTDEIQVVKDKPYIGIYYSGRYPGKTDSFTKGLVRYKVLYGVYPEGTPEYEQRSLDANKKLIRAVKNEIKVAKAKGVLA